MAIILAFSSLTKSGAVVCKESVKTKSVNTTNQAALGHHPCSNKLYSEGYAANNNRWKAWFQTASCYSWPAIWSSHLQVFQKYSTSWSVWVNGINAKQAVTVSVFFLSHNIGPLVESHVQEQCVCLCVYTHTDTHAHKYILKLRQYLLMSLRSFFFQKTFSDGWIQVWIRIQCLCVLY